MTGIWIGLGVVFALYAALLAFMAFISVHPIRIPIYLSPGSLGLPQEDLWIDSEPGVQLRAWWVEADPNTSFQQETVAILAHGYVMNRCELVPVAQWLHLRGISSLLFDFRKHGNSSGKRVTMGVEERHDVAAAVRWVRNRNPRARVLLIGSSMGSVASAMALADDPHLADALVLDSAYSQLVSATKGWWYLLGGKIGTILLTPTVLLAMPLSGLNPWRIDVSQVLAKFATPVLVLHGDRDSLATPDQAKRNVTALGDRATVEWFPGCAHSEGRWIQPDRYYQALESFLKTQRMLA